MTKRILSCILSVILIITTCITGGLTAFATEAPEVISENTVFVAKTTGMMSSSITTEQVEDEITVHITVSNLDKHSNGEGTPGYWTGFAVVAPSGAEKMKMAFGTEENIDSNWDSAVLSDLEPNVAVVGEEQKSGVAFYADAGEENPKTRAKLQWYGADDTPLSAVTTFVMDLSNVTINRISKDTVYAAISSGTVQPYITTEQHGDEIMVTVTAENLEKHKNAENTQGYWAGFAVVAPTENAKMKYAFDTATNIDTTWDAALVTVLEEHITEDGEKGVAFYVNAGEANPKTVARLQWYDEDGVTPISSECTFFINIDNVTLNVADYTPEMYPAIITDDAETSIETSQQDDVINVNITANNLANHINGQGTPGYWTGFAVVAPSGAENMKVAFGTEENIDSDWDSAVLSDLEPNVAVVGEEQKSGVAFYADAGAAMQNTVAKLQWFDAENNAVTKVQTFILNLSDVSFEGAYDITLDDVKQAIVKDSANSNVTVYSSYNITPVLEGEVIKVVISARDLKSHRNAGGTTGYWTGFAVVAPEGATNMKYVFDTQTNIDWSNATYLPTELSVFGETDGVAFYADINAASPKTHAMLQWFDGEGNPLSNIMKFKMDLSDAKKYVAPIVQSGGGSSPYYKVKFETNGGSKVLPVNVKKGEALEKPADPIKDGYVFDGWYEDKSFNKKYDFYVALKSSVTLYAKWTKVVEDITEKEPTDNDTASIKFADVLENKWYYDFVTYAVENGLMNGVSESKFAPELNLTRGMFVTILYRIEGEPLVGAENRFRDVPLAQYYTNAIIWASSNGIVSGVNDNTFAPDTDITREQMATIIHRYVEYRGMAAAMGADIGYTDSDDISAYAIEAVKWAKANGILKGNADGSFAPKRNSTRAEAAAMFVRLVDTIN